MWFIELLLHNFNVESIIINYISDNSTVRFDKKEKVTKCQLKTNDLLNMKLQAEIVKSSLTGEWENLNSTVEGWLSRWRQTRSRLEETHGVLYTEMANRCRSVFEAHEQWDKFIADRDELM